MRNGVVACALAVVVSVGACADNKAKEARRDGRTPVVLRADGLGVAAFGADRETVERRLTASLGAPTGETSGRALRCADDSTRIVTYAQYLTAYFSGDNFTGWSYFHDPKAKLRTAEGATIGTSIDRLHKMYGPRIQERPLGVGGPPDAPDFVIDGPLPNGIAGRASRYRATVDLRAGRHCGQ
jgi:hypothetical protein